MDGTLRENLLASSKNKDASDLINITKQLSGDDRLTEALLVFSRRQLEEFWDGTLLIFTSTLTSRGHEDANLVDELCELLQCVVNVGNATLQSLLKTKSDRRSAFDTTAPQSMLETAIILHGILPTLSVEQNNLKDRISRWFESWWTNGFSGREELMGNTILYLLTKSTQTQSTQADVTRVKAVQKVLSAIDLSSVNASMLYPLLLQSTHHHKFVTNSAGIKFLSYLFTLDENLMVKMHMSIKNHLLAVPKQWLVNYGEIYFRAWQGSSGDLKELFELSCIQDLMFKAVHANRSKNCQLFNTLFKILSYFHKEKTQRGVEPMLTKLYEPILWRSLMVANSDVRANAATLMFDVFPLYDPSIQNEQSDVMLQKQFDLMQSLLSDPVPEVRLITVKGIGHVLNIYWELIPAQVIQFFVSSLIQDQVYDVTTPAIREAVLKVMYQLCDNHLCITMLKSVLPELRNFVHDTSEKVRLAMFDVLLKVKGLRAIKYFNIVPVEHILARLEIDSPSICEKIMKLILHSFVPVEQQPEEIVRRCATMLGINRGAARQFYMQVPKYLSVEETVEYILTLCRYLLLQLDHLSVSDGSSINDSANSSHDGLANPQSKKTKAPKRSHQQRGTDAPPSSDSAEEDEGKEEGGQAVGDSTHMCGMTEAMYLMLTAILDKLTLPENKQMKEGLYKKLSIAIRKLLVVSQGKEMDEALIAMAGHLPGKALPLIGQNLLNRLKHICRQKESSDVTTIIKTLVQWGHTDSLIELVQEPIKKALSQEHSEVSHQGGRKFMPKAGKKTVGFAAELEADITIESASHIVVKMISLAESRVLLLKKHRDSVALVLNALAPVLQQLGMLLHLESELAPKSLVLTQLLDLYLRLAIFLCIPPDDGDDVRNTDPYLQALSHALEWTAQAVLPFLDDACRVKQGVASDVTVSVLKMFWNLMLVNIQNEAILDHGIHLCQRLLEAHPLNSRLCLQTMACLYHITQLRTHDNNPEVKLAADNNVFSCLRLFLSAYVALAEESIGNNDKFSDVVSKISDMFTDVIRELTKPGKPLEQAEKIVGSLMTCAIEETKISCQKNGFSEDDSLPSLSSVILTCLLKKMSLRRLLVVHIEKYLWSEDARDMDYVSSLVKITSKCLKADGKVNMRPVVESLHTLVSGLSVTPGNPDSSERSELKTQLEKIIQQWLPANTELLPVR